MVCGLNGGGKTTFGRALAEEIGAVFIDKEELYFEGTDTQNPFAVVRSPEERQAMLWEKIRQREQFVLASVKGDFGQEVERLFTCIVLLEVPKDIRMVRIRRRSLARFGNEVLPGGSLYEQDNAFLRAAEAREKSLVTDWLLTQHCPVIRLDGTRDIRDNIRLVLPEIRRILGQREEEP